MMSSISSPWAMTVLIYLLCSQPTVLLAMTIPWGVAVPILLPSCGIAVTSVSESFPPSIYLHVNLWRGSAMSQVPVHLEEQCTTPNRQA